MGKSYDVSILALGLGKLALSNRSTINTIDPTYSPVRVRRGGFMRSIPNNSQNLNPTRLHPRIIDRTLPPMKPDQHMLMGLYGFYRYFWTLATDVRDGQ